MKTAHRIVVLLAVLVAAPAWAQPWGGSFTRNTLPAGASYPSRDYYLYVPSPVPAPGSALVVFLHGCVQTATHAALGVRWNELADGRGFLVVYPEQHVPAAGELDGDPAYCWNTGQAPAFPRGEGELESLAVITRQIAAAYAADPRRIYITGISSGAMMASSMAATYPDLYAAVGSVAGCGYGACADATGALAYDRMAGYARRVPAFIVHGSTDDVIPAPLGEMAVEQWVGTNDLADDGARNGSVSPIPTVEDHPLDASQVSAGSGDLCVRSYNNPCPGGLLGIQQYPYTVRRYRDAAGNVIVESWLVHGLLHNYPGGDPAGTFTDPTGPDVTTPAFDFFESGSALR